MLTICFSSYNRQNSPFAFLFIYFFATPPHRDYIRKKGNYSAAPHLRPISQPSIQMYEVYAYLLIGLLEHTWSTAKQLHFWVSASF